jgi:hypothetical protein
MDFSTGTSTFVEWLESAATEVPILGYKLYRSQGTSEFALIYSELNLLVRFMDVTGLQTGQVYQFQVAATNSNGGSEMSDSIIYTNISRKPRVCKFNTINESKAY